MNKFCKHCQADHPLTAEFWYRLEGSPRCKLQVKAKQKKRQEEKPDMVAETQKKWREKNKESRKQKNAEWRASNIEKHRENARNYYYNNKDKVLKRHSEYMKNRRQNDPAFRLTCNLRTRMNAVLRGRIKSGSSVADLGCSPEELKVHLESLFTTEMTWDNYGTYWEVDHVMPLCSFNLEDRNDYIKAVHYTNLSPLRVSVNRSKGGKVPQN